MSNFTHDRKIQDEEKIQRSLYFSKMIKEKNRIKKNYLSYLLLTNLNSGTYEEFNINEIQDFPILKKKHIIENIIYGTFQFRLAVSYLADIKSNLVAKRLSGNISSKKILRQVSEGHKIIALETKSRHRNNSITYRIFIEYFPSLNKIKKEENIKNIRGEYFIKLIFIIILYLFNDSLNKSI